MVCPGQQVSMYEVWKELPVPEDARKVYGAGVVCEECCGQSQQKKFDDKKSEATKHRTEWCAEAEKYRCMRCGRGSKYTKMPGKCTGPKYLSENFGKWGKRRLGGHDLARRTERQGETLIWYRICEAENATTIDELLQAGACGHEGAWTNVETNSGSRGRQSSSKGGKQ